MCAANIPDFKISEADQTTAAQHLRKLLLSLDRDFTYMPAIDDYCERVGAEQSVTVLAKIGDTVIGAAFMEPLSDDTNEMVVVAVDANFQRSGVGSALTKRLEEMTKRSGKSFLFSRAIGPSRKAAEDVKGFLFLKKNSFYFVKEFSTLWEDYPCAFLFKPLDSVSQISTNDNR
jgi:GNAT superfamily N-acetyltransferase